MALTKLPPLGPKSKGALSAARWAVPLLLAGGRWLADNPETLEKVRAQIDHLIRTRTATADGMLETISVLRGNVDYLATSADDELETRQARRWEKELAHCEQAALLLKAPGASGRDRRAVRKRLTALRSDIVEAFIAEQAEDARRGR